MREHAHWKTVAQHYPCSTCGAAPGEPCRSYRNHPQALPHVVRTKLASDHQWEDPEEETFPPKDS